MHITRLNPADVCAPGGHYSHAVIANGLVFISGQLPVTPSGEKLVDAPFEAQARQVLDNLSRLLIASGSRIDLLTQVRVYVADIDHWPTFNALFAKWTGDARPARTVVPVPNLHYGFLIELEAVAVTTAPTFAP